MPIYPLPTLTCPTCQHPLEHAGAGDLGCTACQRRYLQCLGIPDLRWPPPAPDPAEELTVANMLAAYAHSDFAGLVQIRLHHSPTSSELRSQHAEYLLSLGKRGQGMIEMFQQRAAEYFPAEGRAAALDLGCGTGSGLLTLCQRFTFAAGIDPSLANLLLARKALETAGMTNFQLVQAYGQHVPYAANSFDYTNALNVLEHVFELEPVLREVYRTLKLGGVFAGDSRNRYDLFLPEPHVKLRWVGFVPRRWQARYVYWRLGVSYHTARLLSYGELKQGMRHSFGKAYRIVFPYVNAYGGPGWVNAWLRRLERLPLVSDLALWVFPSHLALGQRTATL